MHKTYFEYFMKPNLNNSQNLLWIIRLENTDIIS